MACKKKIEKLKVIEIDQCNGIKDNSSNIDVFSKLLNIQNQQKMQQLQQTQHQIPTNQYITEYPLIQDYSVNGFEDSNFGFSNFCTGSLLGIAPMPLSADTATPTSELCESYIDNNNNRLTATDIGINHVARSASLNSDNNNNNNDNDDNYNNNSNEIGGAHV